MARLSLYLPPLAGDYSGVCSTLFGLDCLVIIVDASCCTKNYVEYDEPRWERRRKTAFSAQLRTLEAVLGDDSRIIEQACEAVEELRPACVAVVGSPVPAIMGMDLAGIACEVEARTGVPSMGLPTTGFETCETGVSMALEALVRRFAPVRPATAPAPRGLVRGARVNVLGLSPHDFASEADMQLVRAWLEGAGVEAAFCPDDAYALADVARAAEADASLVVSWAGLAAARHLRDACGVPFTCARPLCVADVEALLAAPAAPGSGGMAACEAAAAPDADADACENAAESGAPEAAPLLIVGEQLFASALRTHARRMLARRGVARPVVVSSLFAMDAALAEPQDFRAPDEAALADFAAAHPGCAWVGDLLFARIPELGAAPHLAVPHEAVSSTLYERERANLAGEGALRALETFLEEAL